MEVEVSKVSVIYRLSGKQYSRQELIECMETLNNVYNNRHNLYNNDIEKLMILFDGDCGDGNGNCGNGDDNGNGNGINNFRIDNNELIKFYYMNSKECINRLLFILIQNKQLILIKYHYHCFFTNSNDICGDILPLAIETNDVDIMKTVIYYGYKYNWCDYYITPLAEYNDVELLDIFVKSGNSRFSLPAIKNITKEIFLYCYKNGYHTKYHQYIYPANKFKMVSLTGNEYNKNGILVYQNILTYIVHSNYNKYIVEYLMLNEYFDLLMFIGGYVKYRAPNTENMITDISMLGTVVNEIKNKYIKMFENEGIYRDIGNIIIEYLF